MKAVAERLVLDTSVVGPLVIPGEQPTLSSESRAVLLSAELLVPAHWYPEVADMLRTATRRGRVTASGRDDILLATRDRRPAAAAAAEGLRVAGFAP